MELLQYVINGLLCVGIIITMIYLKTYITERTKTLAQTKDIEKLTTIVEGVKSQFTKETELLKADLQRLNTIETSHRNEERNCIIDFYGKYNQWLYAYMEINYSGYHKGNIEELIDKRTHLEKYYAGTCIAESKVKLLVKNDEIISLANQLLLNILQFKTWFDIQLLGLQFALEDQKRLTEKILNKWNELINNKELSEQIVNEERDTNNKVRQLQKEFNHNKVIEFKKTLNTDLEFRNKVKYYLTK